MEKYAWIRNRIKEMEEKGIVYICHMKFSYSYWTAVSMHDCHSYSISDRLMHLLEDGGSAKDLEKPFKNFKKK